MNFQTLILHLSCITDAKNNEMKIDLIYRLTSPIHASKIESDPATINFVVEHVLVLIQILSLSLSPTHSWATFKYWIEGSDTTD